MKKFFRKIGSFFGYINRFIIACLLVIFSLILYIPFRILFPIKVQGRKNLKNQKTGQLIACNHYSNFDVWMLQVLFFKRFWLRKFLAKKELGKNCFSRTFVGGLGAIFIDRNNLDLKAMKEVLSELKKGKNIIIFPEGTRNKSGSEDLQDIKSGVIFFADRAKCNIVPMIIKHRIKPFHKNQIIIGEGYKVTNSGKAGQQIELDILNDKFQSLREM